MANYLLATKEIFVKLKDSDFSEMDQVDYITEFKSYFQKHTNPIFKVLLGVINNDFDEAINQLKKCKNLDTRGIDDWFLFIDLKNHPDFDEALKIASS